MAVDLRKCFGCARMTPAQRGACAYCGRAFTQGRRRPARGGRRRPRPGPPRTRACAQCRRPVPPGHAGCPACEESLEERRAHFLVVDARPPLELEVGKEFVIGRDDGADLTAYAPDVSREHAMIRWDERREPPRPFLAEVRSSNGTWLNERPVPPRTPVRLCSGDAIRLGETFRILYYHLSPSELGREMELQGAVQTRRFTGDGTDRR